MQEWVNGALVEPGTVRFDPDLPTYSDGSADFPGTRFANSAAAVVQLGADGKSFKAVSIAVAPGMPQSAVSGEMTAVQLLGIVLARGRPDGLPHGAGGLANHADCAAVIATFRRHRGGRVGKAGSWEIR